MGRIFTIGNYDADKIPEEINSTIKPIEEDDANSEIEKDEVVLNPDMGGLWKALGKSHSKGGTPVNLRDGSFIFSNHKSLSITEKEKELFEIKDTAKKVKENTPAALLRRIVDPKDYNKLVNVLSDPSKDDISKQSATLLLQKYMKDLGNIAYLQEAKKGGDIPEFAMGSAPVYKDSLKNDIDISEQFKLGGMFQEGGRFRNPFNWRKNGQYRSIYDTRSINDFGYPQTQYQMQPNGYTDPRLPFGPQYFGKPDPLNPGTYTTGPNMYTDIRLPFGPQYFGQPPVAPVTTPPVTTPQPESQRGKGKTGKAASGTVGGDGIQAWPGDKTTGIENKSRYSTEEWRAIADSLGFKGKNNLEFQKFLANNPDPEISSLVAGLHKEYSDPINGQFDGKLGVRWDAVANKLLEKKPIDLSKLRPGAGEAPKPNYTPTQNNVTQQISKGNVTPNSFEGSTILPYNPNVPLSPLQSMNLLYSAQQALTVPKFLPMRPQVQSPLVELEKLNAQPLLNQIDNATYQAYQGNSTLNPILQAAQNAAVYGKSLDSKSQTLGNVMNQNVQIGNQQNIMNNEIQRGDLRQNTAYNQQYYDSVQRTNANYADETRAARNATLGLFNQYRSENDALAAQLMSQRLYTKPALDKRGNAILDAQGNPVLQQAPIVDINTSGWTPRIYHTGAGDINQVPSTPQTSRFFDQTFQGLLEKGVDAKTASVVAGKLAGDKEALQYSVPGGFKMGGIKRMRK